MSDGLQAFDAFLVGILFATIAFAALLYRRRPPTPGRTFGFLFVGQGKFIMSKTFIQGSSHTATVAFTDANGVARPLPEGHIPAWSVSPDGAVALTPAEDGMSCGLVVGATDEDFTLTCTVEADPEPGVNTIIVVFAGTVVDPEDTQGVITVD